jgi:hypothetical protein
MRVIGCMVGRIFRWTRKDRSSQLNVGGEQRMKCKRGRGTSAASRCVNSNGDITTW